MSTINFFFLLTLPLLTLAQQPYINNKQLNCSDDSPFTKGFECPKTTLNSTSSSCLSYATFRTTNTYNTPSSISLLLSTSASQISRLNNLSSTSVLPSNTLLLVPLPSCTCSSSGFYEHVAVYTKKTPDETFYTTANVTFQGLSTCQAMMAGNKLDYRNFHVGDRVNVPLRCACPSKNQTMEGFRYLLSYIVTWDDTIDAVAEMFGANSKSIWAANELKENSSLIFPFTTLLVPLKSEPVIKTSFANPPDPSSPNMPSVTVKGNNSSRKWLFIGIGIAIVSLFAILGCLFCLLRRNHRKHKPPIMGEKIEGLVIPPQGNSWSMSSETVRFAIGSLTVYKFEELEKATGSFEEANRIRGSVYRSLFKGDEAAVKIMRGDVSDEIGILKQINHSNIIRLSGFCVHDGNTYLVYEYADNGSLDDWLPFVSTKSDYLGVLGWKQRVQIAYDVADALNYLHNYTNPPYVHKNLKSSNILLSGKMRAKVSNFGLARSLGEDEDLQMTRHVVGTHGYMAPEYIENGLVTPKLDVFSFGVVLLEILSGKEAARKGELLSATISEVLEGEDVRGKLEAFVDPSLEKEYPFDLAFSLAQLAKNCVASNLNSRPSIAEVFMTLSKILSSSKDWDPSKELDNTTRSLSRGR